MTQLRMVGLFGVTTVLAGFVLVVWRIVYNRGFLWLLDRHLWTAALAVYLYAITPVDAIVYRYNVARVLAGDPAPSTQISTHPIDAEGYLALHPLVNAPDPIIREGIRAMLAAKAIELESRPNRGWSSFQWSERRLLQHLQATRADWARYTDRAAREAARKQFDTYSYQWY